MTDKDYDQIEQEVKAEMWESQPYADASDEEYDAWQSLVDAETQRRYEALEAEEKAREDAEFEIAQAIDAGLLVSFLAIQKAVEERHFEVTYVCNRHFASRYLAFRDGDNNLHKIRVSDHPQPCGGEDGGWNEERQERHCAADISVAPEEDDLSDAIAYISQLPPVEA